MVIESRRKNSEDRAQTPEPANGRYPFLNRNVGEEGVGIIYADEDGEEGEDEDADEDEDEEEHEEEEEEEWQKVRARGNRRHLLTAGRLFSTT